MAIKVLGDIVIDDDGSLKNVTSITYGDASVQTTAQTGVPPNTVTTYTAGALVHTLDNPNAFSTSSGDYFGVSVAVSGNYAIVGATNEDDSGGSASGKAYIFNVTTGALVHILDNPNAYDVSAGDNFGHSVAISGNYAIVGAPYESDSGGPGSGKAYIFNVLTGVLVYTLNNPNTYSTGFFDFFGFSVAISGNYAIAGAYSEDEAGGSGSGKAYIFNVTTGALVHTLNNPNAYSTSTGDGFGSRVAIFGNSAIVSALFEQDAGGINSGKAYIFNVTTGALVHTLDNPNAYSTSDSDVFGYSVAMSGNNVIVGAQQEDDVGGVSSSKAYIFSMEAAKQISNVASLKFANGTDIAPTLNRLTRISAIQGELMHVLDNPNTYGTSSGDGFGVAVAISGNFAIVGVQQEDDSGGADSGKAYIFNVTTGALVHTLNNPNTFSTSAGDYFGSSVAISGNYAIVAAHTEDDASGSQSGKVYIFNVTSGALVHTLNNPNAFSTSASDFFGGSVAISGNYAIVGAYSEDQTGFTNPGKAYIYNVTTGALTYTLDDPNVYGTPSGDNFGYSVAMSGSYAAVGAYAEGDTGGAYSGKVYIFNTATGALVRTLSNPNAYGTSENDYFGTRIAISGNHIIVSAHGEDDVDGLSSGRAYIFNVTTGALVHTLSNPNAYSTNVGDNFASSVTISNNYAIVGANTEDDTGAKESGKAYVYNIATGALVHTLSNPNAYGTSENDYFGSSIAISGNYAIVGVLDEGDSGGAGSGKAYIFAVDNLTTLDRLYTLVSEA